jgi:hypothetical protein
VKYPTAQRPDLITCDNPWCGMWGTNHTHPIDLYRECLADKTREDIDVQKRHRLVQFAADAVEAIYHAHAEAEDMDAAFDGGEFSGPAHDRMMEREARQIVETFRGVTFDEVETELMRRANEGVTEA